MNTHTVSRHVKHTAMRQYITTHRDPLCFYHRRQTLVADLCFIFSLNPQLQLGGSKRIINLEGFA
jgi:hypothetical protein